VAVFVPSTLHGIVHFRVVLPYKEIVGNSQHYQQHYDDNRAHEAGDNMLQDEACYDDCYEGEDIKAGITHW